MKLFKASWVIWQRFERITMSIELFGWRAVNEKVKPHAHFHAIEQPQNIFKTSKIGPMRFHSWVIALLREKLIKGERILLWSEGILL